MRDTTVRSTSRFPCRPGSAAAAPTRPPRWPRWRGCGVARRWARCAGDRGAHWRRRAVLSLRRHGARSGTRRGDLPARRSAAALVVIARPPFGVSTAEAYGWYDEDRAAGLREMRELQMLPVPWPSRAAQMINDLEPPVLRRHPGDRHDPGATQGGRGRGGGHVRQRLGGFWPVSQPRRRRACGPAVEPRWCSRSPHPHREPQRARASGPSDCPPAADPVDLTFCGRASGSRRGV